MLYEWSAPLKVELILLALGFLGVVLLSLKRED